MTQQNKDLRATVGYKVDKSSVAQAVQANQDVAQSYRSLSTTAAASSTATVRGAQQTSAAYRALAQDIDRVTVAQRAQTVAASATTNARQLAGTAGGLLATVGAGAIGSAAASTLGLVSQFGPLGIAVAGTTLLVGELTRAEEVRTKVLAEQVSVLKEQADLVASGKTTADVQAQIANLEAGRKVLDDFIYPLLSIQDRVKALTPNLGARLSFTPEQQQEFDDLLATANRLSGQNFSGFGELDGYINGLLDTTGEYTTKIDALQTAIDRGIFIANDAAAANAAFADSLQNGVTKALSEASKSAQEVAKRFSDARTEQYDAYREALDIEAKVRDELTKTSAVIDDIRADRDAKLLDLAEDDRERRIDIETSARERIAQIVQDSADRVAKIMRDAGREQGAAIGRRDALAHYESRLRAADALKDQKVADERAINETAKAMTKQLQIQERAYAKQVQQANAAAQKQLDIQYQTNARLVNDLRNATNARLVIEQNLNSGLQGMAVAHANAMIGVAYQGGVDMVSAFRSAIQQGLAAGGNPIGSGTGNIPGGIGGFGASASSLSARSVSRPLLSSIGASGAFKPALMGNSPPRSRSISIVFAPNYNGARMTNRDFDRHADNWFDRLHREIG
jgi:hypothetical protein